MAVDDSEAWNVRSDRSGGGGEEGGRGGRERVKGVLTGRGRTAQDERGVGRCGPPFSLSDVHRPLQLTAALL